MQNFIVCTVMSHLRSRSGALLKNHFKTNQVLYTHFATRCCGPSKSEDKKKDLKKCSPPNPPPKVVETTKAAVVLSGCGHLDGSCIYETVSVAINLYRYGVTPVFFAPKGLHGVINHQTSCPSNEERTVIKEGARLARGKIQDLAQLRYCDVTSVIFPGGAGITKTFTTFDSDKANCCVDVEVMRVLEEFHDARKPMAFTNAAAILPARLFPCVKITLGMKGKPEQWPYQYFIEAACQMGAEIETREVDGYSFDKQHMVFSTPAYLYNGNCSQVFEGISLMIQNMIKYIE